VSEQDGSGPEGGAAAGPAVRETDGPVERFLAGVRAALADLPGSEVEEILEDVRSHLGDLAAELGDGLDDRALADRLGTPAGYAAELRAAAGYPPPPAPAPITAPAGPPGRVQARLAVAGLVVTTLLIPLGLASGVEVALLLGLLGVVASVPALVSGGPGMSAVAELPAVRSLAGHRPRPGGPAARFLADLQVGWWVVRALLAALVLSLGIAGTWSAALPLALVTVPASILIGRWSQRDRRAVWLVAPLNALALVVALIVVARLGPEPEQQSASGYPSGYSSGLSQDGDEVRDIRPVDANGVPLTGVYLFDQDGHPIDTQGNRCEEDYGSGGSDYYDSGRGSSTSAVQPYPRGTAEYGSDDRCVVVPPGPLVVAVPPLVVPTSAVPTSAATISPGPTAAGAPTPTAPASVVPTPGPPSSAAPPTG
jgi:uncharacterized membrane protein